MYTEAPITRLERLFQLQKTAFLREPYPSEAIRIERMHRVPIMLRKHRQAILAALAEDFSGHSHEMADLVEILSMFERAEFNIKHVGQWMKPVARGINPVVMGKSRAYVHYQPKGVIGNMVSWNFPFDIGFGPTLDALAAGNRVIVKPSDLSPACGRLMQSMVSEFFDESELAVVNGELDLARHFPTLPWDHLVYTGSGKVGREVMKAAAANLVPVTLELGGKCPCVIDQSMLLAPVTIESVAGVKAIKRGQMCVSVDYCLVPQAGLTAFTDALTRYMREHFTADNGADHACGIISERHLARLNEMVDEARRAGVQVIQIGRDLKPGERNMPFYLVVNPGNDLAMMREEIFGPILPIRTYTSTEDAVAQINAADRPLGLYVFSANPSFVDALTRNTQSGGVAVNTIAAQAAMPSMGFGGSGGSGMGRHHGIEGFREFSNPRGYFERRAGGVFDWIRPPYGTGTRHLINDVAYAGTAGKLKFAVPQLVKNLLARSI
jgi:coniferyl-aldehyde dehydrogenase